MGWRAAENHEITGLFELLTSTLNLLNDATKNFVNLLFNFEFRLAKLLGFEINLDSEIPAISIGYSNVKMFEKDIDFLKKITRGEISNVTEHELMKPSEIAIENFFESHYKAHFDNLNFSNTKKVIFSKEIRI